MGKVGFKIAIVEFRGKIYAGYEYEDGNVWHFQEINGLGHFTLLIGLLHLTPLLIINHLFLFFLGASPREAI